MGAAAAGETATAYVRWEEVVKGDKGGGGRKEVYYYLKRNDGSSDLAVVGKEKSSRHMSYHFAVKDRSFVVSSPKLRSRREVIDWLNSMVPGSDLVPLKSLHHISGTSEERKPHAFDLEILKDIQLRKLGKHTTEFSWLGSDWTCRRKRRHYQSFQRNGATIYVHDFVYVLAEENKRLVAYLDDMYEDSKGNKMVVVRWFHKIDEVGIVLPHNYNDREIFFSLCLQDLSIECIDGLATVLSPQHYEKFLKELLHTRLKPFICLRQFDNNEVKPFDITQVKGYWKQDLLRYMFNATPPKVHFKLQPSNDGNVENRPKKRLRRSKDCEVSLKSGKQQEPVDGCLDVQNLSGSVKGSEGGAENCCPKEGCSVAAPSSGVEAPLQEHLSYLTIGSQVEVLSQDSGIRGCWFKAQIIKKHKDKMKVRYEDIKDAANEATNLEEWILGSRVAVRDELGLRAFGRTTVRPNPPSSQGSSSLVVNAGSIVDVWWHDGWWEGIAIRKESEDGVHVYFPGEKSQSIFGRGDLRPSLEWIGTGWNQISEQPELVTSILSGFKRKLDDVRSRDSKSDKAIAICDVEEHKEGSCTVRRDSLPVKDGVAYNNHPIVKSLEVVRDLSKDVMLMQLKWKSSKKRNFHLKSVHKLHQSSKKKKDFDVVGKRTSERFFIASPVKIDHDNCKYIRESFFGSSVVPTLTSLVMSR